MIGYHTGLLEYSYHLTLDIHWSARCLVFFAGFRIVGRLTPDT